MPTLGQAVAEARLVLQDTVTPYRYPDADLLSYANDSLNLLVDFIPELFSAYINCITVVGADQQLPSAGSLGLDQVMFNEVGGAVRQFEAEVLDAYRPSWRTDPPGSVRQWSRIRDHRYRFLVYPPAIGGVALTCSHIAAPTVYALTDVVDQRLDTYIGNISDYVTGMAEAREDESAGPNRSALFMKAFTDKMQARVKLKGE